MKHVMLVEDEVELAHLVRDYLEAAGFEIKGIDTIGVHYSATLWRWYRNWMGNREKVEAKYGKRWFRVSISVVGDFMCFLKLMTM